MKILFKWLTILWLAIGVPVTFAAYSFASYSYALGKGRLPVNAPGMWLWYGVFVLLLLSGCVAIWRILQVHLVWRILATCAYLLIMVAFMLFCHFQIAAYWGDSL